jgi:hypothetical protein
MQRAGMKGISYTYFTTDNAKSARELITILREAKAVVPPQLEEMSMYGGSGGGRGVIVHCSLLNMFNRSFTFQAAFQVVAAEVVAEVADTGEVGEVATVVEVEAAGKPGKDSCCFFV